MSAASSLHTDDGSGEYSTLLQHLDAFCSLEPTALRTLCSHAEKAVFQPGEKIIHAGDPGDAMYVIGSGRVRVPILDEKGQERHVVHLGRGDIFGEMSLLTGEPRTADVIAESVIECLIIEKRPLYALLRDHSEVAAFLTEILGTRLQDGGQINRVGKYRLLGEIGRGGVAIVYAGVHQSLKQTVAIKMLNHSLIYDADFAVRFRREGLIIAQLEHENIVRVLDVESAYATHFIVMEMLPGTHLGDHLSTHGPLPESLVQDVVVQVARALKYAHARGIVHRDVKPENIMYEPGRPVKLTDFGLAKTRSERNCERDVIGTPEFMSPEQGRGETVDGRADIYALGTVAFELLTGELPFNADDPFDLIDLKSSEPFPDIRKHRADLSDLMVNFVQTACRTDAKDRFQNAEAILTHFGACEAAAQTQVRATTVNILHGDSAKDDVRRAVLRLLQTLKGRSDVSVCTSNQTLDDSFNV